MNATAKAGGLLFLSVNAASCSSERAGDAAMGPPGGPDGPMEVGVVALKSPPVPPNAELPRRIVASATAEVHPQVQGQFGSTSFLDPLEVDRSPYPTQGFLIQSRMSVATDCIAPNKRLGGGCEGIAGASKPEIVGVNAGRDALRFAAQFYFRTTIRNAS